MAEVTKGCLPNDSSDITRDRMKNELLSSQEMQTFQQQLQYFPTRDNVDAIFNTKLNTGVVQC